MTVITPDDVFSFCGVKSDIRTKNNKMMLALIERKTIELEEMLGAKIETTAFSSVILSHNVNCEIYGNKLYLRGIYRDVYDITSITEEGEALTAITGYNDGNDYYFDQASGVLTKKDFDWSQEQFAIVMSGSLGLVNLTTELPRKDVTDILIEMCAAKSGLWKLNVSTEAGDITTIRMDVSKDAKDAIKRLRHKGI